MGSKPSGTRGVLVASAGAEKGCPVPKQAFTASAPPTPQHPEGACRSPDEYEEEPFPPAPGACMEALAPPAQALAASVGSACSAGSGHASRPSPRQTHSGGPTWTEQRQDTASIAGLPGSLPHSDEELQFDAPLDEVLSQASEAFGSIAASLASPKWDRRVQALKGVGTVLKGLDLRGSGNGAAKGNCRGLQLRDAARCFRAACLVLNLALRDKVLPVVFAAHELYCLAFDHGQSSVPQAVAAYAMATLLEHVLAKLGELNIRLHESACGVFVFSTGRPPRLGLQAAFARLRRHIADCPLRGPPRMRVHAGVLDLVGQLLRRFPGRRENEGDASDADVAWSAADVRPFLAEGVQADSKIGSRVQQAAASLAVTVYATLGKRALDSAMAGLSDANKEFVLRRVEDETGEAPEDANGEDSEDEAGGGEELPPGALDGLDLCVTGVALRPPKGSQGGAKAPSPPPDEECFMDEILEETGLVFQGQGLKGAPHAKDSNLGGGLDEDLKALGLLH